MSVAESQRLLQERAGGSRSFFVYLLLCEDGSYYTGYSKNVKSRFERHRRGRGARYTRMVRPKEVVYVQRFGSRAAAMRMERKIKTLSHQAKHDLAFKSAEMKR